MVKANLIVILTHMLQKLLLFNQLTYYNPYTEQ